MIQFFNPDDTRAAFRIPSGEGAARIVEELSKVKIYFTDRALDDLLIHNHHPGLIDCGSAMEWLRAHRDEWSDEPSAE